MVFYTLRELKYYCMITHVNHRGTEIVVKGQPS